MTTQKNHTSHEKTHSTTSTAHTDEQKRKSEISKVDRPVDKPVTSTSSLTTPQTDNANIEPGTYIGMLMEQIKAESSVRSSVNVMIRGIAGHVKAWSADEGKVLQLADALLDSAGAMADAAASSIEVERAA